MHKVLGVAASLFIISMFTACRTESTDESASLVATETLLRLPLDENTSNVSAHLEYFYDARSGEEMLYSLNPIRNEIQAYILETDQRVKSLPFEVEGDRGVGNISAFYVHSSDSLLLFPINGNRLFLTDSDAINIERINYRVPDGYGSANVGSTFFSAKPYLKNGKLIAKSLYQGNYSTVDNEELSTRHVSYSIDLNNGDVTSAQHTYPDGYMEEVKKHFQFSFSASVNGIAYSFWGDHNLYLSRNQGQEWSVKPAQSQYMREAWEALPLGGDRMDRAKYFATSAHYGNIIWDTYREVYYRFCYPKVEIEGEEDLRLLAQFPTTFSIIILDKELNILGEEFFDGKEAMVTSNAFVGLKGLYISVNHPESPDNQEDFLSFRLFSLEGLG